MHELRKGGLHAEMDYTGSSLKSQMKKADRLRARRVIIIGEDELAKGVAILRDMQTKEQTELPINEIVEKLEG